MTAIDSGASVTSLRRAGTGQSRPPGLEKHGGAVVGARANERPDVNAGKGDAVISSSYQFIGSVGADDTGDFVSNGLNVAARQFAERLWISGAPGLSLRATKPVSRTSDDGRMAVFQDCHSNLNCNSSDFGFGETIERICGAHSLDESSETRFSAALAHFNCIKNLYDSNGNNNAKGNNRLGGKLDADVCLRRGASERSLVAGMACLLEAEIPGSRSGWRPKGGFSPGADRNSRHKCLPDSARSVVLSENRLARRQRASRFSEYWDSELRPVSVSRLRNKELKLPKTAKA